VAVDAVVAGVQRAAEEEEAPTDEEA